MRSQQQEQQQQEEPGTTRKVNSNSKYGNFDQALPLLLSAHLPLTPFTTSSSSRSPAPTARPTITALLQMAAAQQLQQQSCSGCGRDAAHHLLFPSLDEAQVGGPFYCKLGWFHLRAHTLKVETECWQIHNGHCDKCGLHDVQNQNMSFFMPLHGKCAS